MVALILCSRDSFALLPAVWSPIPRFMKTPSISLHISFFHCNISTINKVCQLTNDRQNICREYHKPLLLLLILLLIYHARLLNYNNCGLHTVCDPNCLLSSLDFALQRITEIQNKVVITDRMWARLLSSTNQPSFLSQKDMDNVKKEEEPVTQLLEGDDKKRAPWEERWRCEQRK